MYKFRLAPSETYEIGAEEPTADQVVLECHKHRPLKGHIVYRFQTMKRNTVYSVHVPKSD